MPRETLYALLADAILIVHFAFVAYVVVGLLVVWIGFPFRWRFIRNIWFRSTHLLAMGVVVAESVFGVVCPLTTWEHDLRTLAGSGSHDKSFMEYWVHRIMFFDLEPETFTLIYGVFFLALVLSFVFIPPRWPGRRTPRLGRND